jgi:aminopeptidase YwaD
MHKPSIFLSAFLLVSVSIFAQDKTYAKKLIDTLASPTMEGRGYVKNGDKLAAEFIEAEMRSFQLKPLFEKGSYSQTFLHDVNTFPEDPILQFGNQVLKPGKDYLVHPYSGTVSGTFTPLIIRANDIDNLKSIVAGVKKPLKTAVLLYAETPEEYKKMSALSAHFLKQNPVVILVNPSKLTWTVVDASVPKIAVFEVSKEALPPLDGIKKIKVSTEPIFLKNYESKNVAGYLEGEIKDTFLLLTAHYDHLGRMGSALFPGANDNASGTSMMLNLAKFYAGNTKRPKYSIAFVAFAGEEAGLKGSKYFVDNPPIPLSQIKFVFNIDLMGGGTVGSTIVNGSVYEEQFKRIEKINTDNNLLGIVKKRGKAANSDHYWFSEKGVPAFFMYAEGGVTAYHDVNDTRENLPLDEYDDLFKLIHLFIDGF